MCTIYTIYCLSAIYYALQLIYVTTLGCMQSILHLHRVNSVLYRVNTTGLVWSRCQLKQKGFGSGGIPKAQRGGKTLPQRNQLPRL